MNLDQALDNERVIARESRWGRTSGSTTSQMRASTRLR